MKPVGKAIAHVALLRGVNVGGKNKLAMKELAKLFEAAGCTDVRTYVQSGNVVFQAAPALGARLPKAISAAIADEFGLKVPVVIRTAAQMSAVHRGNPFLLAGKPEEQVHLVFLADVPEAGRVAALDPNRSPGDEYRVVGQEIYLWLPNGVADTKLTNAYFDSKLATVSTGRNWRTVTKLLEMMTAA